MPCPHCHRKRRLLPFRILRLSQKMATIAVFCDSCSFLRQSPFSETNCRRNRRL